MSAKEKPLSTAMDKRLTKNSADRDCRSIGGCIQGLDVTQDESITFSLVTKNEGILTKTIGIDSNGQLLKDSSKCTLPIGQIKTVKTTIEKFTNDLRKVEKNQALVPGISLYPKAIIGSKYNLESVKTDNPDSHVITRTKDNLTYPDGPGLMMLDHDKPRSNAIAFDDKAIKPLTPDDLIKVISQIFPEINLCVWVSTPSTSSCIYDSNGKELRGKGDGFHLYLFPQNAQDIERFLDVLGKRLILAGYGRIEFSKTGSLLVRTIIDLSVGSPERLDFVAGAVCGKGLAQQLPDPHLHKGNLLDTSLLHDLTDDEQTKYVEIVAELKDNAGPTHKQLRQLYRDKEVAQLTGTGMDKKAAIKIVDSRIDGVLGDDLLLFLSNGENITVGTLLANGSKYDGMSMADPVEPEYGGWDRGKAKFYWNDGRPCINSFAHGSRKYTFESFNCDLPAETLQKLYEMNKEYASGLVGGKFKIIKETYDHSKNKHHIAFISERDFLSHYSNKTVAIDLEDTPATKPVGKVWLGWNQRRSFDYVVFDPTRTAAPKAYNLYRGFPIEPEQGDWSLMRSHILDVICNGDPILFKYVIQWMANIIQNPGGIRPGVALVLIGGKGVGKGLFANYFGQIIGEAYMPIATSKGLVGNFNAHLRQCIVVFLDEAIWSGDKSAEGQLKALITEPEMMYEQKGIDALKMDNHLNIIMASNESWVCPASIDERRFCVLLLPDKVQGNTKYFNDLCDQMDNGGVAAMYYDLLQEDIDIDYLRTPPVTKGLKDQILQGLNPVLLFWYDTLLRRYLLSGDGDDWPVEVAKHDVFDEFKNSSYYPHRKNITEQTFWQNTWTFLGGKVAEKRVRKGNKRQTMINLESCEVMKIKFTNHTKITFDD